MKTEEIQKLREDALRAQSVASPEWEAYREEMYSGRFTIYYETVRGASGANIARFKKRELAEHIANWSPSRALALLDEVDRFTSLVEKPKITLTGAEVIECLKFLGANEEKLEELLDEEGLETPITIASLDEWKDKESGETMAAGKYVYFEEYPEEGVHGPLFEKEAI